MKFIELKNIERKDSPIHYINKYGCTVVYSTGINPEEKLIEVILEKTAIGTTNIQINLTDELFKTQMEELEEFINEKYKSGIFG